MAWHAIFVDPVTRYVWMTSVGCMTREGIVSYAKTFTAPLIAYVDFPTLRPDDDTPLLGLSHYVPDFIEVPGAYQYELGMTDDTPPAPSL